MTLINDESNAKLGGKKFSHPPVAKPPTADPCDRSDFQDKRSFPPFAGTAEKYKVEIENESWMFILFCPFGQLVFAQTSEYIWIYARVRFFS